jgi:hypothetical protein
VPHVVARRAEHRCDQAKSLASRKIDPTDAKTSSAGSEICSGGTRYVARIPTAVERLHHR